MPRPRLSASDLSRPRQGRGMGMTWERHDMCELALTRQENGMGTERERHGMCELALERVVAGERHGNDMGTARYV
jgi:hypothetical protein